MAQEMFLTNGDGTLWVDDTNPGITYVSAGSESWQQDFGSTDTLGNVGSTYNHTSHVIKGDGSLSFTFNGTQLSAMGTVTIRNVHARNDPSWSCSIDGIEHTAVNNNLMDTNRWILCTNTSVLASGVHTATINVTSLGTPFYFDYLHYLPAPSVSENSQIIAIDSLNPIIQYDSDWTNAPNGGGHVKQKTGGTLSIQFNGTSISWIGFALQSFPKAPSKGHYVLDFGDPVQFDIPGVGSQTSDEYQQTFFTTSPIEDGSHTLSVTYDGNEQTTPLILDYFLVSSGPIIPNNTQSTPLPSGTGSNPTQSVPGTSGAIGPSGTAKAGSIGSTAPGSSVNHTGAIIGGIVGGIAVIAIVLATLLVLRKRRRSRSDPPVTPLNIEDQMSSPLHTQNQMSSHPAITEWVSPGHLGSKPGNRVQVQPESNLSGTASSSTTHNFSSRVATIADTETNPRTAASSSTTHNFSSRVATIADTEINPPEYSA